MKKEAVLEKKELLCSLINLIVIKMFFTYPRMLVNNSANAAWIQLIYAGLVSLLIFFAVDFFYRHTEMKNIFEISEKIGGKPLKIVVGVVIICVLLARLGANMRIFPETIRTVLLPETPTELISLLFAAAVVFGAYMGIYAICRIHSLFIPLVGIVMLLFVLILIPDMRLNNIFPIAGAGTQKIFCTGVSAVDMFSDMMLIYIIMPFCKAERDTKISVKYAIIIGGAASAVILLVYCLVYPYPISREFVLPIYQLARIANIGQYFQRFDAFFEFSWSVAMLLYSSLYLYVICYCFAESFGLEYMRELIIPIAVLALSIGFIPTNFVTFISDSYYLLNISGVILYAVPFVIGILYSIKKRKERRGT